LPTERERQIDRERERERERERKRERVADNLGEKILYTYVCMYLERLREGKPQFSFLSFVQN
jgi:hypothetical protein